MPTTASIKLADESFEKVPGPLLDTYGDWIAVNDRLPVLMSRKFIDSRTNKPLRMSMNYLVTLQDGQVTEAFLVQVDRDEMHWEEEDCFSIRGGDSLDVVRWLQPLIHRREDGQFKSFWNDDSTTEDCNA